MKANETPEESRGLGRVMRAWRVETPLPPRFQQEVWRRIERAESQTQPSFWGWLAGLLEVHLLRPQFALSYVAALVVLGVAAGALMAQATTRRVNADLGARYVQSLDPFHADAPHP